MKQLFQDLRNGSISFVEAPCPLPGEAQLTVLSRRSLISTGTERMLLDFGRSSLLDKARKQPEKVRQVLSKMKTDGVSTTLEAVRSKLSQPMPLGYCNVGVVIDTGRGVDGFQAGDRVVSNGPHAEVVRVPSQLSARIPDNVTDEQASFTVLGAIGLQGIRLAEPTLGEVFCVAGCGVIGLLTVQMLLANGCQVIATDIDDDKLALAASYGAMTLNVAREEDPVQSAHHLNGGRGVDGVIITAATKSSELMKHAAGMCRKRGRVILVGVVGLQLDRSDFYEKEIRFQVSCSYGPGRYDKEYEKSGVDYPLGFVRWTAQRNFEAVLQLFASGKLSVSGLVSETLPFERAEEAYARVLNSPDVLGVTLEYPDRSLEEVKSQKTVALGRAGGKATAALSQLQGSVSVGFIGAGNYASRVLIPALKETPAVLHTLVSSGGVDASIQARSHGFAQVSTDAASVFSLSDTNAVIVCTRHDSHAKLSLQALEAGKSVFVEKPLAINWAEFRKLREFVESRWGDPAQLTPRLMVGFNRRFSPHIEKVSELLERVEGPKCFVFTVNAGAIPADHWTQDLSVGGGRIVGEACHHIDLMRHLADSPIVEVQALGSSDPKSLHYQEDLATVSLRFADGSHGSVHYFSNGPNSFPKERIEVFTSGRCVVVDNFRKTTGYGWKGFSSFKTSSQDKGQKKCVAEFVRALERGTELPIPLDHVMEVCEATLQAADSLRKTQGGEEPLEASGWSEAMVRAAPTSSAETQLQI